MKITQIRTTPLSLPYREAYHWSGGCPMGATVVLVEVETDAGITGIGESTGDRSAEAVMGLLNGLSPLFVGEPAFDVEWLIARAYRLGKIQNTPRFANHAFAGLEMALWDAIGKAVGQPVHRLLGGATRREVNYFAFLQGDEASELAEDAGLSVCLHGQHDTGISTCAENQISATLPNLTDGNQIMHQLLVEDLIASPDLTVRGGELPVVEGAGLGFDLDQDAIGRAAGRYRRQGQYYQF